MVPFISKLSNSALFLCCLFVVLFFSCLYWLSDWPAEQDRRKRDKHDKKQDLEFLDYFLFSISTWCTVGGGGSRFATADWEENTRYVYACQLLALLYVILISSESPAKYLF